MTNGTTFDPPRRAFARPGPRRVGTLTVAWLVALWGCRGGMPDASSSMAEATVKGTVKVRGKPVTKGTLIFDPANINRPEAKSRETTIKQDGTYEIKAIVGGNSVRLAGPMLAKEPTLEYQSQPADIQSGENTINLDFLAN